MKKSRRAGCVYDPAWKAKFPWVQACPNKKHYAWCIHCRKPINIKAGSSELRKHGENERGASMCASLTTFLHRSVQNDTTRGEILIAVFLAEHHIAIRTVDHLTALIKAICNILDMIRDNFFQYSV